MDLDLLRLQQERERRLEQQARIEAERSAAEQGRIQAETTAGVERERAEAEERAKAETSRTRITQLAGALRAFYHRKQALFFALSKAILRATKKTRRSGATAGGCRELVARAIEIPRFRAVYATTTRIEAKARAWRNDTQSGLVDVIERYGERLKGAGVPRYNLGSVIVEVREGDLALVFSNGSLIELFGADDEGAIMKLRGLAKHVYWIDEAQDFSWLERFYKAVVVAGMNDFGGECWLTGTPGRDLVGMFYEVTRDEADERLPGWEIHEITVTDNPFFGRVVWERGEWFVEDNLYDQPGAERSTHPWIGEIAAGAHRWGPFDDEGDADAAAVKVRWERGAGATIRNNAWADDDPDALRELKGQWVKEGARFVYAFHARPEHDLIYAPQRLADDGFPDLKAALLDLPGRKLEERAYFLALGADLGTRAAFAFCIWAWSLRDPILYELASWKRPGLDYDEMAAHLHAVRAQVSISLWTADAGGGGKPAVMGWSKKWVDRYKIPIVEATKQNKRIAQNQYNNDIRKGLMLFRKDSPLLVEGRGHRWKPLRTEDGKEVEDSTAHDALDASLYGHRESYAHRWRPEEPKIVPGSPESDIREVAELEAANCEQDDLHDPYSVYRAHG
jgi:hypothetical protein